MSEQIQLPDTIPEHMLVAIRPDPNLYRESFWIAKVLDQLDSGKYRIRFYECHKGGKWKKANGKHNVIIVNKDTILYAGVVLNQNQTMSVGSQRHIDYVLKKEKL
jgi:hypothetical protein